MLQSGTYKTRYQRRQVLEGLCGILLVRGVEVGEPAVDEPGLHPNLDRSFQTHKRNSGNPFKYRLDVLPSFKVKEH